MLFNTQFILPLKVINFYHWREKITSYHNKKDYITEKKILSNK